MPSRPRVRSYRVKDGGHNVLPPPGQQRSITAWMAMSLGATAEYHRVYHSGAFSRRSPSASSAYRSELRILPCRPEAVTTRAVLLLNLRKFHSQISIRA